MSVLARLMMALAATCAMQVARAEVQVLGNDRGCPAGIHGGMCLRISGWIVAEDVTRVRAIGAELAESSHGSPHVVLDSGGGDIHAAIALGHLFRRMEATAVVGADAECLSACVFVLAGATQRTVAPGAKVGIHQPYLVPSPTRDRSEVRREYDRLSVVARTFLSMTNVPTTLYEAMNQVPSYRMRMLSSAELSKFRLDRMDPVWHGIVDAADLKRHGLDRNEYVRRKRMSVNLCAQQWTAGQRTGRFEGYVSCTDRVMAAGGRSRG